MNERRQAKRAAKKVHEETDKLWLTVAQDGREGTTTEGAVEQLMELTGLTAMQIGTEVGKRQWASIQAAAKIKARKDAKKNPPGLCTNT